jgi:2-phosphosulfolactate phosphatase
VVSATAEDASQSTFDFRFDWGLEGLHALAPLCDVIVVIDVLRFTSVVSAAIETGAVVIPFRWRDDRARAYADEHQAVLAGPSGDGGPTPSPTDLLRLDRGTRVVLPSPNGSTISFAAAEHGVPFVLAGSLRNASATARRACSLAQGGGIGVIASGERWGDGSLRPASEDLIGAGAVLDALDPSAAASPPWSSPEARAARAVFVDARATLAITLAQTASGRELIRRGRADDVATASELDATPLAAQLIDGEFVGV